MAEHAVPRRLILAGLAALPLGWGLLRLVPARAESGTLAATPACGDDPTPKQTEGPYWTADSPQRNDFSADGAPGLPMTLTGTVAIDASSALDNVWRVASAASRSLSKSLVATPWFVTRNVTMSCTVACDDGEVD